MNSALIIFLIILCIYILLSNSNNKQRSKQTLVMSGCVLLALESGLRHISVGPDTIGYYANYSLNRDEPWSNIIAQIFVTAEEWRDPGYAVFAKLFSTLFYYWHIYLLFLAFFYFYAVRKLLIRYVESLKGILLSFALLCSLFHVIPLSGMRQQITMAISMFMIPYIDEKKWKPVLFWGLLGSTVHISMLFIFMFIPLIYLRNNYNKKILTIAILLIPIISSIGKQIIGFMVSFIANDYYSQYAEIENKENPIVYVILCSTISVYIFMNGRLLKDAPKFFIAATILMTLFVPLIFVDGAMIRMGQYYTIYMMIIIPYIFERVNIKDVMYNVSICILTAYMIIVTQPYYFFFQSIGYLEYWYGY